MEYLLTYSVRPVLYLNQNQTKILQEKKITTACGDTHL